MNTINVEGWIKGAQEPNSRQFGMINIHVSGQGHIKLERLEESLQNDSSQSEAYMDFDDADLQVNKIQNFNGEVNDWQVRLFLSKDDEHRGRFHLVGHDASNGDLIYTNTIMVDQLG